MASEPKVARACRPSMPRCEVTFRPVLVKRGTKGLGQRRGLNNVRTAVSWEAPTRPRRRGGGARRGEVWQSKGLFGALLTSTSGKSSIDIDRCPLAK